MRGKDFLASVVKSQAGFYEAEIARHGQGGRGQDDALNAVEKALAEQGGDIDRGRLQKHSSPPTLPPEHKIPILSFQNQLKTLSKLTRAAGQIDEFFGTIFYAV